MIPESTHDLKLESKSEVKYSICDICACRCGIKVTLKDGNISYIQGDPSDPINQGMLCAKGSAALMQQSTPARLTKPLLRKREIGRGEGGLEEISWEKAYDILATRLQKIRSEDPKKLAFFTGRDQAEALTSYWVKQFGTPNYSGHGGFCSVNIAAGMIYSMGGTCWEFGGPDWDHTKYLLLIGVAEDHNSNPLKIGIGKLKDRSGKLVVINPVKSGYGAIADEWLPIKPGTDGALLLGFAHVLIKNGLIDYKFLEDQTNATQLVVTDTGGADEGLFWQKKPFKDIDGQINYVWDRVTNGVKPFKSSGAIPMFEGHYKTADGKNVAPAFELLKTRILEEYTPAKVSKITSISQEQIERIALEIGSIVKNEGISLPIEWTDSWGVKHKSVKGAPISIHAMRGVAAHSNGFQSARALSILMMLLGIIDRPGGFRHKPPYPKPIPPSIKPINSEDSIKPNSPLPNPGLGFLTSPDDLMVTKDGNPIRIDKAYSWEYPLTAQGMIQNVITNCYKGDPYKIDMLILFMTNMGWNSSMNSSSVIKMLTAKEDNSDEYKIPFIVTSDTSFSEQVAYSDLVLPDATSLERYDVISMLGHSISDYSSVTDAIRQPVLEKPVESESFQETLVKLANRLGLPGFSDADGAPLFKEYKDFVTNWQVSEEDKVGFLAGWRGADGSKSIVGEPNVDQWERYKDNNSHFQLELNDSICWNRNINQGYLDWALEHKLISDNKPIVMKLYSEVLQRFRVAANGKRKGRKPPNDTVKKRILKYFDPLPFWYPPLEDSVVDQDRYSIHAITQRPMPIYNSLGSQNGWLRQIIGQNYLYINPLKAKELNLLNLDWVWVESSYGKIRAQLKFSNATAKDTVWSWSGIGKMGGAWSLDPDVAEVKRGFLLNHLIAEEIKNPIDQSSTIANADPITGQAGWYDLRVRIYKSDQTGSYPEFQPLKLPVSIKQRPSLLSYIGSKKS